MTKEVKQEEGERRGDGEREEAARRTLLCFPLRGQSRPPALPRVMVTLPTWWSRACQIVTSPHPQHFRVSPKPFLKGVVVWEGF